MQLRSEKRWVVFALKLIRRIPPALILVILLAAIILAGALLYMLPFSTTPGNEMGFSDALIMAVSAVCVTGLTVVDISTAMTGFGQLLTAVLIHIGGLGIMTTATVVFVLLGRRIGLKERVLLKESLGHTSIEGLVALIKRIAAFAFVFELIGALVMYPVFAGSDGHSLEALKISLFHSVSSFNNAGFDIMGGNSLSPYADSLPLQIVTMLLIITGGLGFTVLYDISQKWRFRKLTMHSKIVIVTSLALIAGGALLLWLAEGGSFTDSLFMSVAARTTGFRIMPLSQMSTAGLLITMALMFVGASPGSTGGGIKTTTFFTLIITAFGMARGKTLSAFSRKISHESIIKAFAISFFACAITFLAALVLAFDNPGLTVFEAVFESVSVFSTAGLSSELIGHLDPVSKAVMMVTMFCGRLGPLTIAYAWRTGKDTGLDYVEESITVG